MLLPKTGTGCQSGHERGGGEVKLREAVTVLLDEIDGLRVNEMVGQINPVALKNVREALKPVRR